MKKKKLTATTLAKMTSRNTFAGAVRPALVVPNKKRKPTNWRKELRDDNS